MKQLEVGLSRRRFSGDDKDGCVDMTEPLLEDFGVVVKDGAGSCFGPGPERTPLIPMYAYPMTDVLKILSRAGVDSLHLQLTDHGGETGAICVFEKTES